MSGCQRGQAPSNGLVHVANLGTAEVSLHWQSPGVLGTPVLGGSGTEPIRACSLYVGGFAPGDHRLTITTARATKSFTLAAPASGQVVLWVVIRADGTIEETAAADGPASPYCGA